MRRKPCKLKIAFKDNAIQVVVDVRSAPYTRYVPQFNKKEIEAAITHAGLKYVFMGDVIGGKPSDSMYLDVNGKVMYYKPFYEI